ncbi:MAG TPA: YfcE family phosphodiesterase [Patescibacteria group bacterium]
MKFAIISDTHDNLVTLHQALDWIKKNKIKLIIHCGDVTTRETLLEIVNNFDGSVQVVAGNADQNFWRRDNFSQYKNLKLYKDVGELEIDNLKIAFCHFPDKVKDLARKDFNLVFYGHTHRPWQEKINNTEVINPGNLAGLFYKASFAVFDTTTKKVELKILEML